MFRHRTNYDCVGSKAVQIYDEPGGVVEAGAVTPGLLGAVPGGGVVPVNGGAGVLTVHRTT